MLSAVIEAGMCTWVQREENVCNVCRLAGNRIACTHSHDSNMNMSHHKNGNMKMGCVR